MCPGSDIPEISVSSSDNYRLLFIRSCNFSFSCHSPNPTDLQISSPNEENVKAVTVRAYGLLGYTRALICTLRSMPYAQSEYSISRKRYKIASVVEWEDNWQSMPFRLNTELEATHEHFTQPMPSLCLPIKNRAFLKVAFIGFLGRRIISLQLKEIAQ